MKMFDDKGNAMKELFICNDCGRRMRKKKTIKIHQKVHPGHYITYGLVPKKSLKQRRKFYDSLYSASNDGEARNGLPIRKSWVPPSEDGIATDMLADSRNSLNGARGEV
ncbi:MAG: hypothetical protein KGH62_02095 [Candidatus Micrarchaeota archaeon]|nr:hypothetical protein [Candidatus Micrarchaeota archaeon]